MFNFSAVSDECVKCGKCIPVCTIHQNSPDETTSPRGFLDLLGAYNRGDLELDKNAKSIFESCFLCTNCVDVCPAKLPTDMMIEQVRYDIAKKYGIAWYKKMFFWLLRHRTIMDIAAKLGYTFRTCALKDIPEQNSTLPRFPLPIIKSGRLLPALKKVSFLNKYPQDINAGGKRKVAVFIGCMGNYSYTEIGDSLVEVLTTLGIDSFIPKKQVCCGAPAYFTGDFESVDALIKKNILEMEKWIDDVEAIIIPEATCSSMINIDWVHFLHDQPEWSQRAQKILPKVFIATKWLYSHTDLEKELAKRGRQKIDVTYHDPCHAKKTQGVWKEPRALLKESYSLVEMSDPNRCCGFGGVTMQTEKFHLAKSAGIPKAAMIKETKASVVAAECSACRMQLTNALYQNNVENVVFKNPIELIAQALKEPLK
jgi:glycolate oxidase iron-sulfur subunit